MAEIIAGRNPVIEALRAGRPINKIWLDRNLKSQGIATEILSLAKAKKIPLEYIDRHVLDRLVPTVQSQGVAADTASKEYVSLDDLLAISREKNEPAFYLVLDGIEDPQNLGAILRTAEAAGMHGVIVRSRRAVGLTTAVAKASAGAIEYVPVARVANTAQSLEKLKKKLD